MPKYSRTKNSLLNIGTGIGGQVLTTILKFAVRTVFIYTLGKSYLGINGLFSDILQMLSLTELGFDTAINFKLYKPLATGDDHRVRVLMKFYKQAYRLIGAVIFGLGLCVIPLLPVLIKDYDSLQTLGVNAALIFILHLLRSASSYLFFAYRSAIMKADQRKYILDLADYVVTIATNVTQILVLVFLKDFVIYTAVVIVFAILQNLINALIAQHYYPHIFVKEKDSISKQEVKEMLKDCGALFVFKLNNVVLKATDNTVISIFLGLIYVGLYSNYLLFYTLIRSIFGKVYTAMKASMGNLFAVAGVEKKYSMFQVMNYFSVVIFGTTGLVVALCADEIIRVWVGSDYVIAQPFAILVGIEILFYGLKLNLGQIRNVSGAFRQMWFRPVWGVIINLGASVVLVQFIGIHGVIIGTIIADILTEFLVDPGIIHKYSFENYKPVSEYYKKNVVYLAVLLGIGLLDMWIVSNVFVGFGWYSAIVHVLIVLVTVPGVYFILFRKTKENQYLVGKIKQIFRSLKNRGKRK